MIASVYADLRIDPDLSAGLTLHAYRIGEMGAGSGAASARGGNVTVQNHKRENRPTNAILTETVDRWLEVTDPTAIAAHGRWESGLDVGSPASRAEATRLTQSDLDLFKNPREEIQLGIEPGTGEVPGVNVLVGDLAVVTDSTGAS